jgi:hypothetical protein
MIIQVTNQDGDHIGLYETSRTDNLKVLDDVEECFEMAKKITELDDNIEFEDAVDTYLDARKISRVFAEEVFVTI